VLSQLQCCRSYLKHHGQPPPHRFAARLLWVDVEVTPLPMGAQAEGSERTWMGRNRSTTGRKTQIPPDLVVKLQTFDIIGIIL